MVAYMISSTFHIYDYKKRTLETNPVAPQTLHSLLEENLALASHARDVVLLPLNGRVHVLEDLLDRVGNLVTDTVTRDEGHLERCSVDCYGRCDGRAQYKHHHTW